MGRIGVHARVQSNDTVISGVGTGREKLCIPARKPPVCRSGTVAIRSHARARASAVAKPPTIVTIARFHPYASGSSGLVENVVDRSVEVRARTAVPLA